MVIDPKRSLQYLSPTVAALWHPTKNGTLLPSQVSNKSSQTVWWKCPENDAHEWETQIVSRTRIRANGVRSGCPFCAGQKVCDENRLSTLSPEIAKEWHPTKNGDLTPYDVANRTPKKAWWQCAKSELHEWEATVASRTEGDGRGRGCPYCAGKQVCEDNSLATLSPEIAKEWHPTKNGKLTPHHVTLGNTKKVWWQCLIKEHHVWDAVIKSRTNLDKKLGCPFCSGKRVAPENSLATLSPEIAKEWHPTKNGDLTPNDLTNKSQKKVWWQCSRHSQHIWFVRVGSRTQGETGCPHCSQQSSVPEMRFLSELEAIFKTVKSRHQIDGKEIDIFLPDINLGIEYDGQYFHKKKVNEDFLKNKHLSERGIDLIRLREKPLEKIAKTDICLDGDNIKKNDIDRLLIEIQKISSITKQTVLLDIQNYLKRTTFLQEKVFREYVNCLPAPHPSRTLEGMFPDIAREWHPKKNYPLTPRNFASQSSYKVWWQCHENDAHEWEAVISNRTGRKSGCPYCKGKWVTYENSLKAKSPDIAKQWHSSKNIGRPPEKISNQSRSIVWWSCPNDQSHEWQEMINQRTKKDASLVCPECRKSE